MKITRVIHMRAPLVIRIQEMHMKGVPVKLPKKLTKEVLPPVDPVTAPLVAEISRLNAVIKKMAQRNSRCSLPPVILADRNNKTGGATVILTGDTSNPGFVQMQVAWCKYTDDYSRKVGRTLAQCAQPEVVPLRLLASELQNVEDQMLSQLCTSLKNNEDRRRSFVRDWSHAVQHFLPTKQDLAPAC